ncbi:hypothetical protein KP509_27G055800 [Ceratopteris richardii]|uniref:NADH dehydrogenase subunit 4L n=1 Tax=Ceratopteris richardii TaxID=49495 RepID=A0A8T2RIC4_CERRI|nr:hypothetical protein KP509_27G055800 [Ceratopteris richardii]
MFLISLILLALSLQETYASLCICLYMTILLRDPNLMLVALTHHNLFENSHLPNCGQSIF